MRSVESALCCNRPRECPSWCTAVRRRQAATSASVCPTNTVKCTWGGPVSRLLASTGGYCVTPLQAYTQGPESGGTSGTLSASTTTSALVESPTTTPVNSPYRNPLAQMSIPRYTRNGRDRKSTRLNSSHGYISYAVFCLKKKKKK